MTYYKKRSFFERSKEKISKTWNDLRIVNFFRNIQNDVDEEKKQKFQKEYSKYISNIFKNLIEKAESSGLAVYLEGGENSDGIKKEGKLSRSFPNIFHGDFSYKFVGDYLINSNSSNDHLAYFCAVLSKIIYEKPEQIQNYISNFFLKETSTDKIEILKFIRSTNPKYDTFSFVLKFESSELIYVIFRGTKFFSAKDWSTDFEMDYKALPIEGQTKDNKYMLHEGFYNSLCSKGSDNESVFDKILSVISNYYEEKGKSGSVCDKLVVSGHSLGGALASIFAIQLGMHKKSEKFKTKGNFNYEKSVFKCFTFGAPRIGDNKAVMINGDRSFRYINDLDLVPAVPEWMKSHGKDVIVTKLLPPKIQLKIRESLPLIMYSMYDHFPGEYVANIARMCKFIVGKKNWMNSKEILKEVDLKFQRSQLIEQKSKVEMELEKERVLRKEKEKENKKLLSIISRLKGVIKEKDDQIKKYKKLSEKN